MSVYYQDESVMLYHGDHREILPKLGLTFDLIVADPPYGETSLAWDRWPQGWPNGMTAYARSMWCFGSMRMFLDRSSEFMPWKLSQDVVWEKHNGSSLAADRFSRVHEHATHWYIGAWSDIHHETPTTADATARVVRKKGRPAQWIGATGETTYVSHDGGPRLMRSVLFHRSMHGQNPINETEKPVGLLEPLISYGCPVGGMVLDPFAGSASALFAARNIGRRAVGIEARESQCEKAAKRLANATFDFGGVA
jgi:site-specific DNA-methyltransferase (adenine-specific)